MYPKLSTLINFYWVFDTEVHILHLKFQETYFNKFQFGCSDRSRKGFSFGGRKGDMVSGRSRNVQKPEARAEKKAAN